MIVQNLPLNSVFITSLLKKMAVDWNNPKVLPGLKFDDSLGTRKTYIKTALRYYVHLSDGRRFKNSTITSVSKNTEQTGLHTLPTGSIN